MLQCERIQRKHVLILVLKEKGGPDHGAGSVQVQKKVLILVLKEKGGPSRLLFESLTFFLS